MNEMTCPICESKRVRAVRETVQTEQEGLQFCYESESMQCADCGFDFALPVQTRTNKRNFIAAKTAALGVPSSAKLRAWREKWGLNQKQAGQLLGVGPVAFSKYENCALLPSAPTCRLLSLVCSVDEAVEHLAMWTGVELRSTSGRVEVDVCVKRKNAPSKGAGFAHSPNTIVVGPWQQPTRPGKVNEIKVEADSL